MESTLQIFKKDNFWENSPDFPGIKRSLYLNRVLEQIENKNITALIGVRRSGKSTILRQVLYTLINDKKIPSENTLYINLEEASISANLNLGFIKLILEEFENRIKNNKKRYIVFDEIQNLEKWELLLRNLVDSQNNTKLFITGSSAKLLSSELATKLSGRYLLTEVFPIGLNEITLFTKTLNIEDYFKFGGFPNIVLDKNLNNKSQLLEDYFNSILLRDIAQRYSIRNINELCELAVYLFSNNSKLISTLKLSKFLGISLDTVKRYLEYIEAAYMGFFIPKFDYSLKEQIYNPKKFYAIDLGIQNQVSFKVLDNYGKQLENTVFLELRRKYKNIYYWQGKKEVDFVVKQGLEITHIINVAYSVKDSNAREREFEGLKEAMLEFNKTQSLLVTLEEEGQFETEAGIIDMVSLKKFVEMMI